VADVACGGRWRPLEAEARLTRGLHDAGTKLSLGGFVTVAVIRKTLNLPTGRRHWMVDSAYILTDSEITSLSNAHLGMLFRLWCHACLYGSIPADLGQLVAILGTKPSRLRPIWGQLRQFWTEAPGQNGRVLTSPMMQADAEAYASKIDKRKASGRKGGLASGASRRSKPEANASTKTKQNEPTALHLTSLHFTAPHRNRKDTHSVCKSGAGAPASGDAASGDAVCESILDVWNKNCLPEFKKAEDTATRRNLIRKCIKKNNVNAAMVGAALQHLKSQHTTGWTFDRLIDHDVIVTTLLHAPNYPNHERKLQ
jgi:hypothetical protein